MDMADDCVDSLLHGKELYLIVMLSPLRLPWPQR